ncbi:hypothetical protein DKX38_001076 [Salix brachista]|uniref:Amino acid transporter transmembrane domain-containing protein n=1 Tax=Salix brachista TaxID=2182728 RepID=A0A5N5P2Q0_9ROSI|nr:hypothetical protein DKX38_001076 [Salix brachista]
MAAPRNFSHRFDSKGRGRGRPKCDYCDRDGHWRANCYKLNGFPGNKTQSHGTITKFSNPSKAANNATGPSNSEIPIPGLTSDQYNRLLDFLSTPNTSSANFAGSLISASAHIITAVIGSGVLSLAWAMAQLGWIARPVSLLIFSVITWYTSCLLADCYRFPGPLGVVVVGAASESSNTTRKLDQTPTWAVDSVCSVKEKGGYVVEERKVRDEREGVCKESPEETQVCISSPSQHAATTNEMILVLSQVENHELCNISPQCDQKLHSVNILVDPFETEKERNRRVFNNSARSVQTISLELFRQQRFARWDSWSRLWALGRWFGFCLSSWRSSISDGRRMQLLGFVLWLACEMGLF